MLGQGEWKELKMNKICSSLKEWKVKYLFIRKQVINK